MRLSLIVITTLLLTGTTFAQSSKKQKANTGQKSEQGPSSLNPYYPPENYGPKSTKKSRSKGPTYTAEQKFYERVEAVAKERKKTAKLMEKPQYSNPMYFGHKRPPKKRPPHRMKFCDVCGIRH